MKKLIVLVLATLCFLGCKTPEQKELEGRLSLPFIVRWNGIETCIDPNDYQIKWTADCPPVGPCYCPKLLSGDFETLDKACYKRCESEGQTVQKITTIDDHLIRCDCAVDI